MISDLVAEPAHWFQCAARTATEFSPFSTTSQMVTAKAPPLPPVFLSSLLKIKWSWWRWHQFLPTLPSRPQLRWCLAPQFNSQQGFHNLCLVARLARKASIGETRGKTNDFKSKLACILQASESTRMRMEETLPKYHEDHIAGKGDN